MLKEQKTNTVVLVLVVILGISLATPVAANTVIPYTIDVWTPPITFYNGWTYIEYSPGTLWLTANPSGGIIADIDVPTGIGGEGGGLGGSRHDLPDYSLHNHGFIQLEYSSFSSVITGNPEGVELCLEIEFDDADDVSYETGIEVWQDAGGTFFGTWFEIEEDRPYYQTPVPDGISIAEGALGLYSDGSLVLPYFMDAAGSVLYPFAAWDVSGITGTHGYRVDNDLCGTTAAGGTITASVNLERVVYGHTIKPLSGWVWFPDVPDIGYSLDEGDWFYFYYSEPVLAYNFTTGQWLIPRSAGFVFVDWPFMYENATGSLLFILPPE
ncbi:MAG: hypothetical protein ACYS6K_19670, partial [Planctomycetota bacterium]